MEIKYGPINGVSHLRRIDAFLSVGFASDYASDLLNRRLLGIVQGVTLDEDLDAFLSETLQDLDFSTLKENLRGLNPVLARFFLNPGVTVIDTHPYFDRTAQMEKPNVLIVKVALKGVKRFCVLKLMEEGPRRESLGLRINNILTNSPVPFMQSDYTALQMGLGGIGLDQSPPLETESALQKFNFNLGRAEEFGKLLALGDRKPEDILQNGVQVSHVDFGAAFSKHESIKQFVEYGYEDFFEKGREEGRSVIRERYVRNRDLVDALLAGIDDNFIETMNHEDMRKTHPVTKHPAEIVRNYMSEIKAA